VKVSWFHKFGGPEVLVHEETATPKPKPGEALVRVRAVGINHVDLDHRAGTSRIPVRFPHILGREFAGEVAGLNGPSELKEGDRVWITCRIPCHKCEFCLAGRDNLCVQEGYFGLDIPGGYAEYVCVPIANLNALPSQVSFENAAAAQIAFGTAWHVLITQAALHAGQTVLIQAAGSGIGSAAVQVAKLAGAGAIITTASSEKKLEHARALGATHLINYGKENFVERVMAITGGRGVDVVMEHIGGDVFTQSLQCLARGGIIVTVGAHAGEVVQFDIIPFFRKELRLAGSKNAPVLELRKVMGLVADGKLKPIVHKAFPLAQAAEAHRVVDSRDFFGKVVLVP
jgi:NADPH:quinone reductase-like Zn-dependent oxidoreductase